jgi:hypothetical protein
MGGRSLARGRFRRRSAVISKELDPEIILVFSAAWFGGFCRIKLRKHLLNTSSPWIPPVNWCSAVQLNQDAVFCRQSEASKCTFICHNRPFPPSENMDRVSIPFEFLDGYTEHLKGENTGTGKIDRSGEEKAMLIFVPTPTRFKELSQKSSSTAGLKAKLSFTKAGSMIQVSR